MRKPIYLLSSLVLGVLWVAATVVSLRWSIKNLKDTSVLPGYVGVFAVLCVALVLIQFLLSKVYHSSQKVAESNPSQAQPTVGPLFLLWCLFLILAACGIYTILNEE